MGANIKGPYGLTQTAQVSSTLTHTGAVSGTAMTISADTITTGKAFRIDADALTTGNAVYIQSESSDNTARNLVHIANEDVGADNTTAVNIKQDSDGVALQITKIGAGDALKITSTTSALCLPVMTSAQRGAIANAAGRIVYDTDLALVCFNTGAKWQKITGVADC